MVVMILEKVPIPVRGELSRWLVEIKSGVFVGKISAMVREKLWEKCKGKKGVGSVIQIWSYNNEQGFSMKADGLKDRQIVDYEGLQLVKRL